MSCKIAPSGPKSSFSTIQKPDQSTRARFPESISFASQVSGARVSIGRPSGPRRGRKPARVEAAYGVTAESAYEVLGIGESEAASLSDIKKAYKKMARLYHPDVSPPERVDENTKRFLMVKEAYETLSNPQRRALHDENTAGFTDQVIYLFFNLLIYFNLN